MPETPHSEFALTPKQRRKLSLRGKPAAANGYAAKPGTGPEGETCGSCAFIIRKRLSGTYLKCRLYHAPTGGSATDIKARSPACSMWGSPV